ncbi:MAG: histidine phosphatase family protein [bacterium]|nr:histidine phosphatase family protein [bacterium]
MELILVRHAEPAIPEVGEVGPGDPPLGERGRNQAAQVAEWLARDALDRIVSSPARRARETAEATATRLGLEVVIDDRLRDAEPAGEAYVPIEVARERDPGSYRARMDAYRDASRLGSIAGRVNASLDEWAARHRGGRVAVFCHGSVVNAFAVRVLGLGDSGFLAPAFASGHRFLVASSGVRSVKSLNETAYLMM